MAVDDIRVKGFIANTFILFEYILVLLYFRQHFDNKFRLVQYLTILVFLFCIYFVFRDDDGRLAALNYLRFNGFNAAILCLNYMVLSISAYFFIMRSQRNYFLERSSFFWGTTAILIYATGVFLLFLFTGYLVSRNTELSKSLLLMPQSPDSMEAADIKSAIKSNNHIISILWNDINNVLFLVKMVLFTIALRSKDE